MHKLFLYSLLLIVPFMPALQAMESTPQESVKITDVVQLLNKAGEKVELSYKLKDKSAVSLTLEQNESIDLGNVLNSLENLYVTPYGKVRGWMSLSALTGGLIKSANLVELDEVKRAQKARENILITITPTGEERMLGRVISAVAPYSYDVKIIVFPKDPYIKGDYVRLLEMFPQANTAFIQQKPVLARYILNVAEKAGAPTVEAAFNRLQTQWNPKLRSSNYEEARLAQKVLELALQAKLQLMEQQNNFGQLIAQELNEDEAQEAFSVPKPTVITTEVPHYLGMNIITDPSQLTEEQSEQQREMGMVFRGDPGFIE